MHADKRTLCVLHAFDGMTNGDHVIFCALSVHDLYLYVFGHQLMLQKTDSIYLFH